MANSVSGEFGNLVSFKDAASLREAMSKITNLKYEIVEANSNFPPPSDNAKWYLFTQGEMPEVYHARTTWISQEGKILIQSMYLGSTSEWIERDYGDADAAASTKLDYPDLPSAVKILDEKFPMEAVRLRAYQKILDDTSAAYGICLQLRIKGGKVSALFYIGAIIDAKKLGASQFVDSVKLNLNGLKEALDAIEDYEDKRKKQTA